MNYIAHIHLGVHTRTSLLGNFLGDFVKGPNFSWLPLPLQLGVKLHRKVDQYTDAYSEVIDLKRQFPASLRRMSGVVLDIYFDHLLLNHWLCFSEQSSTACLAAFYQELEHTEVFIPGRFDGVRDSLLKHRWLAKYKHPSTCLSAFLSIEKRLRDKVVFAEQSMLHIERNHYAIEQVFLNFYPQLQDFSKATAEKINQHIGDCHGS